MTTLIERLRDPSSVRSWGQADEQRAEAAAMIERMQRLLMRSYGYLEDWKSDSQESAAAYRSLMEELNAVLDQLQP